MSHNDKRCSKCPEIKVKDDKAFKNHSDHNLESLKSLCPARFFFGGTTFECWFLTIASPYGKEKA